MKALAETKDWEGLESFAKSRKSPIGYEPFVVSPSLGNPFKSILGGAISDPGQTHLLSLSPPQPDHAANYVQRCDPKSRPDLYVRCGDWGKAAEACRERGDRAKLE